MPGWVEAFIAVATIALVVQTVIILSTLLLLRPIILRFAQIASNFNGLFDRFTHISATRMAHPRDFSGLVAEHQALVEAIARRDRKAAAKLIRRHVEASHKRTQAAFNTPMFVP